jgi:hypothetical protein
VPYDSEVGFYTKVSLPSQARRTSRRPPKHLFAMGPVPVALIARCHAVHPWALALLLRCQADACTLGLPVVVGTALARSIGLHPKTKMRALVALQAADLIEMERARGKAPRVWFAPDLFQVPR